MNIIDTQQLDIKTLAPELEKASRNFFSAYGTPKLLGRLFFEDLNIGNGQDPFEALIEKCGYEQDFSGFFYALFSRVMDREKKPIRIHGTEIPLLYVYHLLEIILPGNHLHVVKTISHLEEKAFVEIEDPSKLQEVIDFFPVRLSDHVIRQSLISDAVAKQYLPFVQELDDTGNIITFDGHFKNGVLEQMYENRVIFLLDMHCPVYCRFCFRKHKSTRKEKTPSPADVDAAVAHVRSCPSIHEILITGGEPLLNKPNLESALNGLIPIDHVNAIRIATRSIAYYPELFLKDNGKYIQYLIEKNAQCQDHGKRIEMGIHFVHPDEVSTQSLEIISRFVKNGIQVYVQTPFLNGVNTDGQTLGRLFTLLRQAGAQIYYIFTPCHTIHGTKEFWSPLNQSFSAQNYLRKELSDRCVPKLCTATALGKIEWHTSGWAVKQDEKDPEFTWIRTPYTLEYFKQFIQHPGQMPDFRENPEGTLDAKFRLSMGSETLLCANRKGREHNEKQKQQGGCITALQTLYAHLYETPSLGPSICRLRSRQGGTVTLSRVHKTRVEIKTGKDSGPRVQLAEVDLDYIREQTDITDVVMHWNDEPEGSVNQVCQMAEQLKSVSHIVCLRLRCGMLCTHPETFTPTIMNAISQCADFSTGNPFRVEMETWFLLPEQISDLHTRAVKYFINNGVNVYANVPLITGINDSPATISSLAHTLRQAKIEFHHLYAAGLDIQKAYGCSLDYQKVIDIASLVRTACSGRQIPLYMVQTPDGEIDFGLDPSFIPFSP